MWVRIEPADLWSRPSIQESPTSWRNWIARQTSNLTVAGSNPVEVEQGEIETKIEFPPSRGGDLIAQIGRARACVPWTCLHPERSLDPIQLTFTAAMLKIR